MKDWQVRLAAVGAAVLVALSGCAGDDEPAVATADAAMDATGDATVDAGSGDTTPEDAVDAAQEDAAAAATDTDAPDATPDTAEDASDATAADTTAGTYEYGVPLDPESPWPKFRRTARQDGRSPVVLGPGLDAPWVFPTGKGIFSTPVIGGDGTIYVGSADRTFYALRPDGTVRWSLETAEIIDSSALLDDAGRIVFGSGDGRLYCRDAATGEELWTFEADDPATTGGFINWFEGNVAMLKDGTLLVPNDNFRVYAIDRVTGAEVWHLVMPDQTWSLPAVDPDSGNLYLGNNNLLPLLGDNVFGFDATGQPLWSASSKGTVAASPLLTPSGLVVVGGFDGYLRAYDATTGAQAWALATRDHLYASPAQLMDGTIVQPSADGTVYGVDPANGAILWAFDTREALRSSPAIDGEGRIYLGSGEGRLYVLEPDGTLRWAMQLIEDDRNDLNASPALGTDRVVIAGESGDIFAVPTDWCLRPEAATDGRCIAGPGEDMPGDGAHLLFTTLFGALLDAPPSEVAAHESVAFSLLVREGGDTTLALLDADALTVTVDPPSSVRVELSSDRRFFTVVPEPAFATGAGAVTIEVKGSYLVDPEREGLAMTGGVKGGDFADSFEFSLTSGGIAELPLPVPPSPGEPAGVWELYRMAAPLPTILPSYNQIGFDSLHYLVGLVTGDHLNAVGWVVGARIDEATGETVVDPETRLLFPVSVSFQEGRLLLENKDGFAFEVLNVSLAFDTFRVAARVGKGGVAEGPALVDVTAICSGIAFYGPFLKELGFCNPQTDALSVHGAVLLRPFGDGVAEVPDGVGSVSLQVTESQIVVTLEGSTLPATKHRLGILLTDAVTGEPVSLGYGPATKQQQSNGALVGVTLEVEAEELPGPVKATVLVDTVPVAAFDLE